MCHRPVHVVVHLSKQWLYICPTVSCSLLSLMSVSVNSEVAQEEGPKSRQWQQQWGHLVPHHSCLRVCLSRIPSTCRTLACEEWLDLLAAFSLFFFQTHFLLWLMNRPLEVYLSFHILLVIKDHDCHWTVWLGKAPNTR